MGQNYATPKQPSEWTRENDYKDSPTIGMSIQYAKNGLISMGGTMTPTAAANTGSQAFTI
jgi:hypothetical protein